MAMGLIHIDQLDTIYQSYGLRKGHLGSQGSVIFTKNANDCMVWPALVHIDLDTLTRVMGLSHTWGTQGSKGHFH